MKCCQVIDHNTGTGSCFLWRNCIVFTFFLSSILAWWNSSYKCWNLWRSLLLSSWKIFVNYEKDLRNKKTPKHKQPKKKPQQNNKPKLHLLWRTAWRGNLQERKSLDSQLTRQRNDAERWLIWSHVSSLCQIEKQYHSGVLPFAVLCPVPLGHNAHWLSVSILQLCGICVKLGLVLSQAEEAMELRRRGEVDASLVL